MLLRWLLSTIGLAALKGEITAFAKRAGRCALLVAIAGVCWLIAFGFALGALVVWLSSKVGPIGACGIVAAAFIVLALVLQLALTLTANLRRDDPPSPLAGLTGLEEGGLGASAGSLGSMVIVAVAGYLIGRRIFRR